VTPRWSIVIPAFNEARRLPSFLDTVVAYFEGRDELYEVIVVDDGSTDGTSAIVDTRQVTAVRVLRLQRNAGKGAAVRAGMLAARGAYRLFADADGATPIEELKRLEPALMAGADVVIGSRALVDSGAAIGWWPTACSTGSSRGWASKASPTRSAASKRSRRRPPVACSSHTPREASASTSSSSSEPGPPVVVLSRSP